MKITISGLQRGVLLAAALGILHSSMVPPVVQGGEYVCRYAQFVERRGLFTRGYDTAGADVVALLSEYGVILSAAAILCLLLGFGRART